MNRLKSQFSFQFHFCFDPEGSSQAIALDVVIRWNVPGMDDHWFSETVLRATRWVREDKDGDIDFCPLSVRYHGGQLRLGRGRQRARFKMAGAVRSGGNMAWDVVRVVGARQAHVLNWLRRQQWDIDEWDEEFRTQLWDSRRPLDRKALRRFGGQFVRQFVANTAAERNTAVAEFRNTTVDQLLKEV